MQQEASQVVHYSLHPGPFPYHVGAVSVIAQALLHPGRIVQIQKRPGPNLVHSVIHHRKGRKTLLPQLSLQP